ncbi:hypothetical protein P3T73_05895 [Kiritimatiellota bacterium B12222]|nr:hypothetical protein P3T73_05895 [Kiritimatiellota bacterium B12222]
MKQSLFTLLTLFLTSFVWAGAEQKILLSEDFSHPQQGLAQALLNHDKISYEETGGRDQSPGIRVRYAGYERGSQRVVIHYPLLQKTSAATLSFDVLFEENFQWVMGGKLHGLGPENPVTGGNQRSPDRWSARMMFKEEGRISTYLYDQNLEKKWGTGNKSVSPVFKKETWHHVEIDVILNEAGKANGSSTVRIDGKQVLQTQNVTFRGEEGDNTLIDQLLFSTFHGGHEVRWAPVDTDQKPTTVYARFDNFQVVELEP